MSGSLRYYRENRETAEIRFGDGMHEGKITFERIEDDGSRHALGVKDRDRLLAERVQEALNLYYRGSDGPSVSARLDRLEAFAAELIPGAFPHLAHLVPPAHLGDAVKALKGEA